MKAIFLFLILMLSAGCLSPVSTPMPPNTNFIIEREGNPLFSFYAPPGSWYFSPGGVGQMKRGFTNIKGIPYNSAVSYAVKLSAESLEGKSNFLKDVKAVLKTHDYNAYLTQTMNSFTLEQQKEMNAKKYAGKVIFFQGFGCKNYWFEWIISPQANEGRGITVFRSFITCPLVIDGKIYRFNINIDGGIRPEFYAQKAEYDRNKSPEDPEINIDTDELLKTLGDRVIALFKDLRFYGKVSQNYDDVLDKCDPNAGDQYCKGRLPTSYIVK